METYKISYCPKCYKTRNEGENICSECGFDFSTFASQKEREEKERREREEKLKKEREEKTRKETEKIKYCPKCYKTRKTGETKCSECGFNFSTFSLQKEREEKTRTDKEQKSKNKKKTLIIISTILIVITGIIIGIVCYNNHLKETNYEAQKYVSNKYDFMFNNAEYRDKVDSEWLKTIVFNADVNISIRAPISLIDNTYSIIYSISTTSPNMSFHEEELEKSAHISNYTDYFIPFGFEIDKSKFNFDFDYTKDVYEKLANNIDFNTRLDQCKKDLSNNQSFINKCNSIFGSKYEKTDNSNSLNSQPKENNSNSLNSKPKEDSIANNKDELFIDEQGKQVWKVFNIDGKSHFSGEYSGDGNFIVYILNENQDYVTSVANEIGSWKLDKTVYGIPAGWCYYVIEWNNGSWQITWDGTVGQ